MIFKLYFVCINIDQNGMKAKSKHEKDPKLNPGGFGRPRPHAELFDSVVPKPSKEGACYTFVVDRPTVNPIRPEGGGGGAQRPR